MRITSVSKKEWALVLVSLGIGAAFFELLLLFLLSYPKFIPPVPPLVRTMQNLYLEYTRNVIQLQPESAKYDPDLFYTLRPGVSKFENSEFSTIVEVNSAGLRDDEPSLLAPEIVSLGDSFAMGWGVEGEETYAQRIEKLTGLKVLNAGISSYGTVRELGLMNRLDLSNLKYVIVQYHPNDENENAAFAKERKIEISEERQYQQTIREWQRRQRYYPFKYTRAFFSLVRSSVKTKVANEPRKKSIPSTSSAKDFLAILLEKTPLAARNAQWIVITLPQQPEFCETLSNLVSNPDLPPFLRKLKVVQFPEVKNPAFWFILDDHLAKEGHQHVADVLSEALKP